MMKRFLIGLLLILFVVQGWTQDTRLDWAVSAGNPTITDYNYGLSVDDSGNVYTTGSYFGTVDLNTGLGVDEFTSVWVSDIYIHKLDNNGNYKWAKSIGGESEDRGLGIVTDSEGNVYVTGYYMIEADFDPNDGELILTAVGEADAFIMKLDSLGNMIWAKSVGGSSLDRGLGIAVDESGNVYTTGFFNGTVDFDPGPDSFEITAVGGYDAFVVKLDADGNFLWANTYGGGGSDGGIEVVLDHSNNVCITGYFNETIDFNPSGVPALHSTVGGTDCFVLKLDSDGGYLWSKTFGSEVGIDWAYDLTIDEMDNVFTVGWFGGTVDFDPGPEFFSDIWRW